MKYNNSPGLKQVGEDVRGKAGGKSIHFPVYPGFLTHFLKGSWLTVQNRERKVHFKDLGMFRSYFQKNLGLHVFLAWSGR